MITGLLLAFIFLLPVIVWVRRLYRLEKKSFNDAVPYLRRDNPEQLEELLNHVLEASLLLNLGQRQFRKEQLKRIRLVQEFVAQRAHNAAVLQEWGSTEQERTRTTLDKDVRSAARALIDACIEYRISALWIRVQLHIWYVKLALLPPVQPPLIARLRQIDSFDVLRSYVDIKKAAEDLAAACGGDYQQRLAQVL
jgi:hypothetical protein